MYSTAIKKDERLQIIFDAVNAVEPFTTALGLLKVCDSP
jgi:hypothetical protein